MRNTLRSMYLDYFNNFLSMSAFAEHYGISTELANQIIKEGRELHEQHVERNK